MNGKHRPHAAIHPSRVSGAWAWPALITLALLLGAGCDLSAPAAPPVPTGAILKRTPPGVAEGERWSSGNVTRPTWQPVEPLQLNDVALPAVLEFELARPDRSPDAPRQVTVSIRAGTGQTTLTPTTHSAYGWHRVRIPLEAGAGTDGTPSVEGSVAVSIEVSIEVDGTPLSDNRDWLSSVPRLYSRSDSEKRDNVLVIVVDTLRADALGVYGNTRHTSPRIDALAADSILFERAISPAPWTLPALASLFSGLSPPSHGVLHADHHFGRSLASFVEDFGSAGYTTAGFVSGTFTDAHWGLDRGFDLYDDLGMVARDGMLPEETEFPGRRVGAHRRITSPDITDRARKWLTENAAHPFFLFVHYFDPHDMYVAHPGISERFPPQDLPDGFPGNSDPRPDVTIRMRALYEGEVAFTDDSIGQLLEHLRTLDLWDDTIIVFTADHGEEFFERQSHGHGNTLHNELVHVPLMIRVPGRGADPRRIPEPVSTLDVGPTLLELTGLPALDASDGESLVPLLEGRDLVRRLPVSAALHATMPPDPALRGHLFGYRIEQGPWSLLALVGNDKPELTRFRWSTDRWQAQDLQQGEPGPGDDMDRDYQAARRLLERDRVPPQRLDLDEEITRQLEALGYGDAS